MTYIAFRGKGYLGYVLARTGEKAGGIMPLLKGKK